MCLVVRKLVFEFLTRSDTNLAVQSQKMARGLKFQVYKVEGLYYLCKENKSADQLRSNCIFVFAYAKSWFSQDAALVIPYHFYPNKFINSIVSEHACKVLFLV